MKRKNNNKTAITFTEIMVAVLLLVVLLLPVFNFLTKAMKDTDRIYVECVAITHARQIMDTMLYQIPWKDIRESDDKMKCYFEVPNATDDDNDETNFLKSIVPVIFGEGCEQSGKFCGDGIIKTDKGFWIRTRAKVVDLDKESSSGSANELFLKVGGNDAPIFYLDQITNKDADGKYNLIKKIIVQVKWTLEKNKDPLEDSSAKSLFLVGFKSNIEG